MTPPPLSRRAYRQRQRPQQPFLGALSLAQTRVHEVCGNARVTLAMMIAARMEGPVIWITPGWWPTSLNPEGMMRFLDPGRLVVARPGRPEDILWITEEVLRSGLCPLVVAEMPGPPALTPVRRLNLAAETGAEEHGTRPLGLLLTPADGGAAGVESRWKMQGDHGTQGNGWQLTRLRARAEPPKSWRVTPGPDGFGLDDLPASPTKRRPDVENRAAEPVKSG